MRHQNDARPQSGQQQSGSSRMELKRARLRLGAAASSRCRQVAQVSRAEEEAPDCGGSGESQSERDKLGQRQFSPIESIDGADEEEEEEEEEKEEEDCSGSESELIGCVRKRRRLSSTTSVDSSQAEGLLHEHEMATAMAASFQTSLQTTTTATTTTAATTTTTTTTTADEDEVEVNSIDSRPQQQAPHHLHHIEGPLSETELDRLSELVKIIRHGSYGELLELLESRQGFKNLLNVFYRGYTALHYSLMSHRGPDWCKQLIMNGANPNLSTLNGWHSIHLAAFCAPSSTLCYLIEYFADFVVD